MNRRTYRYVASGDPVAGCITIRIAAGPDGRPTAGIWWTSQTGVGSAAFDDVGEALDAAEDRRVRHDLEEVLVTLDGVAWQPAWGELQGLPTEREPLGDVSKVGLSDAEYSELADDIEAQRDA